MTASSSVASSAPASIEAEIRAAVLRPIMSKYSSTDIVAPGRRRRDVQVLPLAQPHARLVVQPHQPQDLAVGEAEVGQPVERDAREAEHQVAGVDRLRHAVERPQRGPVAALGVAVLDVVVHEAEVVPELDRGRARQRRPVVARDRRIGQQAEQRAHPLAARAVLAVEPEVVADHLVHARRGRVAVRDDPHDLRLGVGEEDGQVDVARDGHDSSSVAARGVNVFAKSSLLDAPRRRALRGTRSGTVDQCPRPVDTSPTPSSSRGSTSARPTAS